MIEKPIGHDLASAKELDKLLNQYFNEDQIYRLDHYLGKETLQNILTFRFGNCIFEPLINKEFVDHIQVTAAEDFGIGSRGGYYDETGHLKDVGQNHLLQMLAFSTMENPNEFSNVAITQKRIDILNALKADPKKLVLGQYDGYRSELHVKSNSQTNTFFAFRTEISNDRFRGVPIYVRGGKKMKQTATEISIVFKNRPNRLHLNLPSGEEPNVLIYRIQPNEAIVLKVLSKMPGLNTALEPSYMQFCYKHLSSDIFDPYLRLFYDAVSGDQTFFNDAEEIESEWSFIDRLSTGNHTAMPYKPGSWGPKEADKLIKADGREWLEPSMAFCNIR